jgi:glycosidase
VPEHQKWMNGGKFDGGLLSPEQKQLRQYYVDLLNIAATNAAIVQGEYVDLTPANQAKVHAFIRYSGLERLLIVSNFSPSDEQARITFNEDVLQRLSLDKGATYRAEDLLGSKTSLELKGDFTLDVALKPYSSFIFRIK